MTKDTLDEFIKHVNGLKINRTINKLQVHHTYAPSYSNWKTDIELRRIKNTVDYHKKTFNTNDIAQHYTIFPNGKIATGRDINSTPIGIKGWNTGAICCEIYGNFDAGTIIEPNETLLLGAIQILNGSKTRFFKGTIHKFKLTEGNMSDGDCLNWMA